MVRRRLTIAALGIVALFALLLAPLAIAPGPVTHALEDAAHVPLFGVVAAVAYWVFGAIANLRLAGEGARFALAFACAAGLGLATELAQALGPRDASWADLRSDVLGAGAALGLVAAYRMRARTRPSRAALVVAALVAASLALLPLWTQLAAARERATQWPVLLDGSSRYAGLNVERHAAQWDRASTYWRLQFFSGQWPGVYFYGLKSDWRGYRALVLELENPTRQPVPISLSLRDRGHGKTYDDRFNASSVIAPGSRALLRFALADIAAAPQQRQLRLDDVASLTLFRGGEPDRESGGEIRVYSIRLE